MVQNITNNDQLDEHAYCRPEDHFSLSSVQYSRQPHAHKNQAVGADQINQEQMDRDIPEFAPGDTVVVSVKVKEGNRERLQAFEGVVIAIRNRGLNSAFTVRKMSHGTGVERVFQTYSPLIDSIKVKRRGDVRRAKLYYLRGREGKSARIREKLK